MPPPPLIIKSIVLPFASARDLEVVDYGVSECLRCVTLIDSPHQAVWVMVVTYVGISVSWLKAATIKEKDYEYAFFVLFQQT